MTGTLLMLILALSGGPQARDRAPDTVPRQAAVHGHVTDDLGRPVAGASIAVVGIEPGGARTAVSDAEGRYRIERLPPGRFALAAYRAGYARAEFGQLFPRGPGTRVVLVNGRATEADIVMPRGAVISGIVVDDRGEPLPLVNVAAWRPTAEGGPVAGGGAISDDAGVFRIWGLDAGEYFVTASQASPLSGRAPEGSVSVTVAAGEERSVQISAPSPAQITATVSGTALDREGRPLRGLNVQLYRGGEPLQTSHSNDGSFMIRNVPLGRYTLIARATVYGPPAPGTRVGDWTPFLAMTDVVVNDEQPVTLSLTLGGGTSLSGRFVAQTTSGSTFDFSKLYLRLVPADLPEHAISNHLSFAKPSAATFSIGGIPPGRYSMRVSTTNELATWTLKSVMAGGVDMLDFPIDIGTEPITGVVITVSDRQTHLAGRVRSASDQPASQVAVVVYPRDRRYWFAGSRRVALARPDSDGAFSVSGLPEGDYEVAVATQVSAAWQQPAFLERLAPAARVVLREGERVAQELVVR